MRRQGLLRILLSLCFLALAILGLAVRMVRHEPQVFAGIALPPEPERRKLSGEFTSNVQRLVDSIGTAVEDQWAETFTVDQMNSYFAEDFIRVRPLKLPEGIHSPRVLIEPGRIQLAFRYGHGFWSSVITIDMNAWLVAHEPNVMAVELLGVHAGAVPFSMQAMLERVAEGARRLNLDVTWYRHNGHPTALVRFQPDRPNPSVVLQRLELQQGQILIEGKSTERAPMKAILSMAQPQ